MVKKTRHEGQFIVSYDVLWLLELLLTQYQAEFSELVKKISLHTMESAIDNFKMRSSVRGSNMDNPTNIVEQFFITLEQMAHQVEDDTVQTDSLDRIDHVAETKMHKTINQIDPESFDYHAIRAGIAHTLHKKQSKDVVKMRELFLKELLRNWNPSKEKNI